MHGHSASTKAKRSNSGTKVLLIGKSWSLSIFRAQGNRPATMRERLRRDLTKSRLSCIFARRHSTKLITITTSLSMKRIACSLRPWVIKGCIGLRWLRTRLSFMMSRSTTLLSVKSRSKRSLAQHHRPPCKAITQEHSCDSNWNPQTIIRPTLESTTQSCNYLVTWALCTKLCMTFSVSS